VFSDKAHADVEGDVAVLYIDGAHRYAPARTDIRDWGARVAPGGTMLIHDSFSSLGVTLAILRELVFGTRFRYVGRARSMTEYRADLDGSLGSRVANAGKQLLQLPWFAKNLLVKVLITVKLGGLLKKLTGTEPEWPY
ncbi:MAG: class I SAM-dependent methyltransferase, partial [Actinobacteria bacterium]|nr:class I SAM-dependent methyltransferase [Actinomycetota bacterium]